MPCSVVENQISPSTANRVMSVWEIDPSYWRIVWNDDAGQPLGLVTFERRISHSRRMMNASLRGTSRLLWLKMIIARLREAVSCRLSTN